MGAADLGSFIELQDSHFANFQFQSLSGRFKSACIFLMALPPPVLASVIGQVDADVMSVSNRLVLESRHE